MIPQSKKGMFMSDSVDKLAFKDLNDRLEQLEMEKHALQQVVIAMLATMPPEQALDTKQKIGQLINAVSVGGSVETLVRLEKQKAVFENIFFAVK